MLCFVPRPHCPFCGSEMERTKCSGIYYCSKCKLYWLVYVDRETQCPVALQVVDVLPPKLVDENCPAGAGKDG